MRKLQFPIANDANELANWRVSRCVAENIGREEPTWRTTHGQVLEVAAFDDLNGQAACRAVVRQSKKQFRRSSVHHGLAGWTAVTSGQTRQAGLRLAVLKYDHTRHVITTSLTQRKDYITPTVRHVVDLPSNLLRQVCSLCETEQWRHLKDDNYSMYRYLMHASNTISWRCGVFWFYRWP